MSGSLAGSVCCRHRISRNRFNAAVSNLDDHPRNHAILATPRHWRLSPVFDLMPALAVARERRDLAMACGRFGRYANRVNLLSGAGRSLLGREEAEGIFGRIADTVRDRWHAEMRGTGASGRDCRETAPAFLYDGLFDENVSQTPGAVPVARCRRG